VDIVKVPIGQHFLLTFFKVSIDWEFHFRFEAETLCGSFRAYVNSQHVKSQKENLT